MLGMIVARTVRRNANTTRITSTTEINSVNSMSCTEARIVVVRSITTLEIDRRRDRGLAAAATAAHTRSTVAMMFAPGCRKMMISTAGLPLDEPDIADVFHRIGHRWRRPAGAPARHSVGNDQRRYSSACKDLIVVVDRPGIDRHRRSRLWAGWRSRCPARCAPSSRPTPKLVQQRRIQLRRALPAAHRRPTNTWPTPSTCASFCARMESAASYICGKRNDVGGERENQNGRVRRIYFAVGGIARQIGRQLAARRIDGGLHIACRGIDVAVEIELQSDLVEPSWLAEVISVNAGDAAELTFQRSGDRRCHRLRTGARQTRRNLIDREIRLAARAQPAGRRTRWLPPAAMPASAATCRPGA